ncbi:hypothetical protein F4777DRAFT_561909 [Nemania sp. FL0916]|nr:hypothetical protein F4777DRAFT_561909 [Nemania sp. FL0916]
MSSESQPISPARFAEALKELSAGRLMAQILELRNSIAHLDYSNAELKPFADGEKLTLDQQQQSGNNNNLNTNANGSSVPVVGQPDQDCRDAIAENEAVIARMQHRLELVRAEIETRGLRWPTFQEIADEADQAREEERREARTEEGGARAVNGHGAGTSTGGESQHEAWRDGTFQTGTIRGDVGLEQPVSRAPPEDEPDEDVGMHL